MDIFLPIAICVIILILFSICGWCCKRKREGTVYGYGGTNVTVSTQPVVPPYPVDPRHPTPGPPAPGFAPYPPTTLYPQQGASPYPPPTGAAPYPPYPPTSMPPSSQPPPYDVAVGQPPVQPPQIHEAYSKQAPYNPHY